MRPSIRILVPIFFAAILIHFASSNAFSAGETIGKLRCNILASLA